MERKQFVVETAKIAVPLLGLWALAFLGFSNGIKIAAKEKQRGICPVCGNKLGDHQEAHHRVPRILGGNDTLENCVIVDGAQPGTPGTTDCHESLDYRALKDRLVFMSQQEPNVPLAEVPVSLFKSRFSRELAIRGGRVGEAIHKAIGKVTKNGKHRRHFHRHTKHHR